MKIRQSIHYAFVVSENIFGVFYLYSNTVGDICISFIKVDNEKFEISYKIVRDEKANAFLRKYLPFSKVISEERFDKIQEKFKTLAKPLSDIKEIIAGP